MKIKSSMLALVIVIIMFGGIASTSALGFWKTKTSKIPVTIKDGEFAGQYDPSDIRGSYTFGDISKLFDIPLKDLGKAFGVKNESSYASFQCKELESLYEDLKAQDREIGTDSVRFFVAFYKGLPFEVKEGTYLPQQAVEILKDGNKLSGERLKLVERRNVALPENSASSAASGNDTGTAKDTVGSGDSPEHAGISPQTSGISPSAEPLTTGTPEVAKPLDQQQPDNSASTNQENGQASHESAGTGSGGEIKGTTTFKDAFEMGFKKEAMEKVLGSKITDPDEKIKDFCSRKDMEFKTIKEQLQALLD